MTYHDSVTPRRKFSRRSIRIAVVISIMVMPLVLAGCGIPTGGGATGASTTVPSDSSKTTFADSSTMGTIKKRGRLIVGVRWDVAPFAYQDPSLGSPAGFDVDLVKQIAQTIFGTTNIEGKITWVPLDPRDNELALEQNKVDIVVGRYQITPAKKAFVDFAGPYFADPQGIIISNALNQENDAPSAPSDLNNTPVCVVTGSTDVPALQALAPNVNVNDVRTTVAQCGADLQGGTVKAIVASHVDELQYVNNSNSVTMLSAQWDAADYGIGVHKGTDDLRSFLNDQIEAFKWSASYSTNMGHDSDQPAQPAVDRY